MIDCADCGACCRSSDPRWVPVPPPRSAELAHLLTAGCMTMVEGHCVALEANRCTVYESRPDACRLFEAGGSRCLAMREAEGL